MNILIRIFGITLQIALVTTLATLALGYPVACRSSVSPSKANLLMILVLIPFSTSILVHYTTPGWSCWGDCERSAAGGERAHGARCSS